ncbi:MAG: alpha/beta fold hydrolase [Polyangiaceae bacterium]|nr:alpha/beta fold hydrolase [Polyangiaceae bacterium]
MAESVHRDVTASGVRLRVAERGEGPSIVLLHGLFVDHTTWDGVVDGLSGEFHLVAPDLPGFGESEKPSPMRFPYGVDAFAEAIADLHAGLGLGRVAVVGHGLGGAVAITLAARHAELVSHLVLVDSLCFAAALGLERTLIQLPLAGSFAFRQLWGRAAFHALFRNRMLAATSTVPAARIDYYYDVFNTPAARGSAFATLRSTLDPRPVEARTSRVKTPTLVVWGRRDRVYPAAFGQRLARRIRDAGFELLDTAHCPQEERPREVALVIGRFLRAERPTLK